MAKLLDFEATLHRLERDARAAQAQQDKSNQMLIDRVNKIGELMVPMATTVQATLAVKLEEPCLVRKNGLLQAKFRSLLGGSEFEML